MTVPVKALLAFDAAMKHSSFALAAAELHVTPGAVGQQIQKLEQWLGVSLFVRSTRQVQPTAEALNYWSAVAPALARIQHASDQLRLKQSNEVWLSIPPTLAAKWFAPRMAAFLARHPGISLHLSATTAMVDLERDRADLAIRHFDGKDPALHADLLWRDEVHLYCAPAYVRKMRLKTPADLARATLLHTTFHPHWKEWLLRFSPLTAREIDAIPGQHFDQGILAIEAARHGQGAALSSAALTEAEMRDGLLCEPFAHTLPLPKGYYVVHHRQAPLRPAAVALRDWLLEAATQ
ncbi:LysR substrate-binding domain-containing protein [Pseudoduganella umbonata]|uniref:LysR family glycine cleavage system transcriptional activator n=1 Tax=Pseudoduganella umbonata TaxID=864828 RepID=A0A4P8HT07_9BURK|nr:LysR substrate-binding domain-containing protein [Pseudoduganella umbonata]MBB3222917.1 LysR family glycine cleavage system transcriptional activator [Pseudoduganella umbonata]QCP13039.1 LysR family transcriptional regulator [Pseudoduganella umbonata]